MAKIPHGGLIYDHGLRGYSSTDMLLLKNVITHRALAAIDTLWGLKDL